MLRIGNENRVMCNTWQRLLTKDWMIQGTHTEVHNGLYVIQYLQPVLFWPYTDETVNNMENRIVAIIFIILKVFLEMVLLLVGSLFFYEEIMQHVSK
jgi:hypothetical protein